MSATVSHSHNVIPLSRIPARPAVEKLRDLADVVEIERVAIADLEAISEDNQLNCEFALIDRGFAAQLAQMLRVHLHKHERQLENFRPAVLP